MMEQEKPGESSIMSFKEVWLTIGELDFQVSYPSKYKLLWL